jgi:hypothetical protein
MGWPFRDSPLKVPRRASGFRGPELVKAPSQPWLPVVEAGPELQSPPPDSLGDKRLYGVHPPPPPSRRPCIDLCAHEPGCSFLSRTRSISHEKSDANFIIHWVEMATGSLNYDLGNKKCDKN